VAFVVRRGRLEDILISLREYLNQGYFNLSIFAEDVISHKAFMGYTVMMTNIVINRFKRRG